MPIGLISPFRPTGTVSIAASAVSSNTRLDGGGETVVVTNTSGVLGYVKFSSDSAVTATTADMPILPSSRLILSINSLISHAAAITPSGSGTILFSRGDGSIL
jgi:hypothetical protein